MATKKTGLGRGLAALIPGSERANEGGVIHIPVDRISPNPRQPRTRADPEELTELADSIREHGVIQPLIVTYDEFNDQYVLIAGERRWLAARQAGLDHVPALIRNATDQQRLELALIENVQRADLSPLEAAMAFHQLVEDFGLSHEEISSRVGKSRVAITNTMRLLKLPQAVQQALAEERISEGHARALLALLTPQAQAAALDTILKRDLTVRQTEELVRKLTGRYTPSAPRPALPVEYSDLEERLRSRLGTRVNLNPRKKGGTLVIHYYSDEELGALIDRILGENEG
jgi:ParB family chromosome partitioning protein